MAKMHSIFTTIKGLLLFIFITFGNPIYGEDHMTTFETLQEFEKFYDLMLPAQENSEESFVWFSGLPHPLFNAIMHLKTNENLNGKIETLISHAPKDIPLSFWAHSQNGSNNLTKILKEKGFHAIATCPLMTWTVKPIASTNNHIEIADEKTFHHILSITNHFDEILKEGLAKLMENVEAENYIIYHENQPIGTGTLIPNGKIGGIFNIAILPEYQKRGYGRAMMLFLMNRASILKLEKLVLLSSPVAEKLYLELEFIKCLDIEFYAK